MDIRNFFGSASAVSKNGVPDAGKEKKQDKTEHNSKNIKAKPSNPPTRKTSQEKKGTSKVSSTQTAKTSSIVSQKPPNGDTNPPKAKAKSKNFHNSSDEEVEFVEVKKKKLKINEDGKVAGPVTYESKEMNKRRSGEEKKNLLKSEDEMRGKKKAEGVSMKRKHEDEPEEISDEEPIIISKKSKKPKLVVSDSDEEDPIPESLRKTPTSKRKRKISSPNEGGNNKIKEAFTRVVPKTVNTSSEPTVIAEERKPMNAFDFFGCTPVQRKESRHFNKKDDDDQPSSKQKVNTSDGGSSSLAEKLSLKKKKSAEKSLLKDEVECMEIDEVTSETSQSKSQPVIEVASQSPDRRMNTTLNSAYSKAATPKNAKHSDDDETLAKSAKKEEDRRKSYLAFVNREPPKALGSKEIPQGAENCLEGLTFVLTGVYESIERDECKSFIERLGGKVTTNVSRNTKYVVVGRDAGASKLSKAKDLGTKQLDEDGLFDLVRSLPGKKSKYQVQAEKEVKQATPSRKSQSKAITSSVTKADAKPESKVKSDAEVAQKVKVSPEETTKTTTLASSSSIRAAQSTPDEDHGSIKKTSDTSSGGGKALLWVDKYKPTNMKNIIGQQGDKSQAKKLYSWLLNWHKNINKKPIFGRPSDDGCGFKAALLSGPPGIGKTTTASVVCQEAGFSFFELNASDTRSKRSLKEIVSEALNSHSLFAFFNQGMGEKAILNGKKHCLVMDEVDGMSGNEDRGGVQELIQLIKSSHIPVICMCNDRNHPKIRSLANYCFDLRFQRPKLEQIKASMMSIAFKEGLKIPPPALNEIIMAANQDIRQVIHNLSMWSAKDKSLTYEQLKEDASRAQKDLHFSPFDVCKKVFSAGEENRKMTLTDKSNLFFHDYNIAPLFVQENYLIVNPHAAKGQMSKHLRLLSRAAESMSMGDLVDGYIRKNQQWSLLTVQAMFASVIPGECMKGSITQMIQFPSWLGKNSTTNKNDRLIQELTFHTCLSASSNKQSMNMDYIPAMKHVLTHPLIAKGASGVDDVVATMDHYHLLREDFDNIVELSSWSGGSDTMSQIDSKVKAAFTRSYNKESHMLPYSTITIKKSRRKVGGSEEYGDEEEEVEGGADDDVEEDTNDVAADAMIMVKKTTKSRQTEKNSGKEPANKKGKQSQKKSVK